MMEKPIISKQKKTNTFFGKKIFILSMWKLTLGYGNNNSIIFIM